MSMGKRKRDWQPTMWVTTTDLPTAASHPFYRRLNQLLREQRFDDFVEAQCAGFYAETMGRPGLPPGIHFRLLPIGYFEGIDSERGIAWRVADSLALRDFVSVGLDAAPPDHSTISRTRRLVAVEIVFRHPAEAAAMAPFRPLLGDMRWSYEIVIECVATGQRQSANSGVFGPLRQIGWCEFPM
jgi:hypothetical protein